MKKQLLTSILTIFFLSLDFIVFAQPGSTATDEGTNALEGGDNPETPINGKILWLVIAGVAFAYYTYNRNKALKTS